VTARLGTLGNLSISASLVVRLENILTGSQSFAYEVLFVPCLLPFVAASLLTLLVFWRDLDPGGSGGKGRCCCGGRWAAARQPFIEAWHRSEGAAAALMGALAFAQLMRTGGSEAPAAIIGYYASRGLRHGAVIIAGLLGAISSFVGGNVVAGNLTFGTISAATAWAVGVPVTSALAMQDVGACAGKMVCLANIVSARAVVNLGDVPEGAIIRHTLPSALILLAMSTATSLLLLLPLPGGGYFLPDLPMPFGHPVF
jgi:lactate permease